MTATGGCKWKVVGQSVKILKGLYVQQWTYLADENSI